MMLWIGQIEVEHSDLFAISGERILRDFKIRGGMYSIASKCRDFLSSSSHAALREVTIIG